jgi:hypothetical protein
LPVASALARMLAGLMSLHRTQPHAVGKATWHTEEGQSRKIEVGRRRKRVERVQATSGSGSGSPTDGRCQGRGADAQHGRPAQRDRCSRAPVTPWAKKKGGCGSARALHGLLTRRSAPCSYRQGRTRSRGGIPAP